MTPQRTAFMLLALIVGTSSVAQISCEQVSTSCQLDVLPSLPGGSNHQFVDLDGSGALDILQWDSTLASEGCLAYYPHGIDGFAPESAIPIVYGDENITVTNHFAIGDFDNDFRPDIAVVEYDEGGYYLALYTNETEKRSKKIFKEINSEMGRSFSSSNTTLADPIVADFDNDGDQDIFFSADDYFLLWNDGNGEFSQEIDFCLPIGSESTFTPTLAADLDGDSYIDLVGTETVSSDGIISNELVVMISDIGPACEDCTVRTVLEAERVFDVGDFNNDGRLDLLAAYSGDLFFSEVEQQLTSNSLRVLLNDGEGLFTIRNLPEIDECTDDYSDAAWADVDADGDLDISTCQSSSGCKIFRNDESSFSVLFDLTPDVQSLTFGDYDHDGRMDICGSYRSEVPETYFATVQDCGVNQFPSAPQGLDVQVFAGHGDALLSWGIASDPNQQSQSLSYNISVQGPINMPSLSDLNQGNRVIVALGNQSLNQEVRLSDLQSGTYEFKVQAVDHSWSGGAWSETRVFEIDSCFGFEEILLKESFGMSVSQCVDLAGDDYLEVLGQSQSSAALYMLLEDEGFVTTDLDALGDVQSRDLNGDNLMDIVVSGSSLLVLLNLGDGSFARNPLSLVGDAKLGDLDQDGDVDIVLPGVALNELRILLNNGDGSFDDPQQILIEERNESIVPLGLFDGDGDGDLDILASGTPDIVVGFGNQVSLLYLENFEGSFATDVLETGFCGSIAIGDIDEDGDKDIVGGLSSSCSVELSFEPGILVFQNTNGSFSSEAAKLSPCNDHFVHIELGDFDQDGKLDIVGIVEGSGIETTSTESRGLIILRNECVEETCFFTEVYYHDYDVQSMAIGDADLDYDLDIYVTTEFGSSLSLLENTSCLENIAPTAPTNLRCTTDDESGDLIFSWDQATDENQNDASLTYQIEVFTEENSSLVASGESHQSNGIRKLVTFGAQCHNTYWRYQGDPSDILCFKVQAIDHSYVGSEISEVYCCKSQICEDAIPIICGTDTIGNLGNEGLFNRIDEYSFCNFEGALTGYEQPEIVYEITDFSASQEGDSSKIFIGLEKIDSLQGDLDLFVFKNCQDVDEVSELECAGERFDENLPALVSIRDVDPEARYFAIVDAKSSSNNFRLSVSCLDRFDTDIPLRCDEVRRANTLSNGSPKISSYYSPANSQYFSQYPAQDYKVQFTAHTTGFYSFSLDSLSKNLDLFVLDQCNPFSVLAYGIELDTTSEEFSYFLSEGQRIYICVDGKQGQVGSFRLEVKCCESYGSRVALSSNREDTLICKSDLHDSLSFASARIAGPLYSYFLTDTFNQIIREVSNSISISEIPRGHLRVYGVAHDTTLSYQIGDEISAIRSEYCAVPSANFVSLAIDSSYQIRLDTSICPGSTLAICDTILDQPGEHTLKCYTKLGCDSIVTVHLKFDTSDVTIVGNQMFCSGDSTRLTAEPDFASYQWSTGATTKSIAVLDPNAYWLTATSENGCQVSDTVVVIELEKLRPQLGTDTTLCFGGEITLDAGPFDGYIWSTGDTTRMYEVVESGEYIVDVRDAIGCTGSDTIRIEIAEAIVVRIDTTICPGTSLQVCDTTYSDAGMHRLICRSARGCDSTIVVNLRIDTTQVTIEGNLMICTGDPQVRDTVLIEHLTTTILTAEPDFATYLWSTGDTTKSIDVFVPNEYSVTVTTENGCRDTATVEVTQVAELLPDLGSDTTLCFDGEITLDAGPFDGFSWSTGATTRILEVVESGEYIVDVRHALGCTGSDTIQIEIANEIIVRIDTTICLGSSLMVCDTIYSAPVQDTLVCQSSLGCDSIILLNLSIDSIDVSIAGNVMFCSGDSTRLTAEPDFASYAWSTEATTKSIGVLDANEYSVTVTSEDGCRAADTVQVIEVEELRPNLGPDTILCFGERIIVDAGPFDTYRWSTGATTQLLEVLESDEYIVDVRDTFGCMGSDTIRIEIADEIIVRIDTTICAGTSLQVCDTMYSDAVQDTIVCQSRLGCDSMIVLNLMIDSTKVTIAGNVMFCAGDSTRLTAEPDFASYVWSTEATTKSIGILDANEYSVTVTSEDGCRAADTVQVIEVEELQPNLGPDTILCFGERIIVDASPFDTYRWSTGATTQLLEVLESDEYIVDVRDTFGCMGSDTIRIEIADEIIVRIDTTICAGTSLQVCDTMYSDAVQDTIVCQSRLGCDSIIVLNLMIDSTKVTIAGNVMFCAGDSTRLTAEPDFASYVWSTEATTKSIGVLDANEYSVTVTSEDGCRAADTVQVIEVEELRPNLGPDTILCFGERIIVDAGPFDTYRWSTGATTRLLEVLESDEYIVDVRDTFGCMGSDTIRIEIADEIIVRIDTTICAGTSLQVCDTMYSDAVQDTIVCQSGLGCDSIIVLNLSIDSSQVIIMGSTVFCADGSTTLTAEPDFVSYFWSIGDTSKSIVVTQAGEYSVRATSENGCADTVTVEVMQVEEFDFTLGEDTTLCDGETLTLAPGIFNSYEWSTGDTSQRIAVVESGIYSLRVEDDEGCEGSDSIIIEVLEQPEAFFTGETTICLGDELELLGEGGENCLWLGPEDFRSEECELRVDLIESSEYILVSANTSPGGTCADTTMVSVTVVDPPELNVARDTSLCEGRGSVRLALDDCDDCICTWTPSVGLSDPRSCSPTVTPTTDSDIMYVVEKVRGGVCRVTDTVFIEGLQYVPVRAINDHTVLRRGTEVTLDLLTHNDSLDRISDESEKIITLLNPSNLVQGIGGDFDNEIRLGADNNTPLGLDTFNYLLSDLTCDDSDEGTVSVQIIMSDQAGICDPTQEPDGTCDLLSEEDLDQFSTRNMVIFDRDGNQVWASTRYDNNWDGRYLNGPAVPTGAYYYVLRLGDSPNPNIDDVEIRGVVTIVRR